MSKIRVCVAGGRDFNNYDSLKSILDRFLKRHKDSEIIIISGHARGADSLGERYAAENGLSFETFPADWEKHGKKAGFLRNNEMAKISNVLIAFWDGKSRGTKNMIEQMDKYGKQFFIFDYDGNYTGNSLRED